MEVIAAAEKEKVFVALPAEFKAGQSTLSWALRYFCDSGVTVVIMHVHVPPQMIPVMGAKFHVSKLSPEQVNLFRRIEREKVDELLDDYIHQCFKMKVKCEKLVFEKEDVADGLVELIALLGVNKLVISAAADKKYSRKMDRPKSRTAAEIMQRADPSCKIWFVCKGKLICTRDDQKEIEAAISPLLPDFDHDGLHLSPHQDKDEVESELEFYDEIKEACLAAENLMKGALNEYFRREKADEEAVAALQKAKEYHKLYLEEVRKREELEGALANAKREIAQLRQATHPFQKQQNTTMDELQEEMAKKLTLERCMVDMNTDGGTIGQLIEPQKEYVQKQLDHDNSARELQVPLNQTKLTTYSLSSVIQSPFDEDCIPSYFCPILQEVMRDP